MIVVDTSVLIYKNLFSAIKNSVDNKGKPIKKVDGLYKTSEFIRLFKHKMLNDLRNIYKGNKKKYGEMVLALDNHDSKNWRKKLYPEYKVKRKAARDKSGVNFPEFFIENNKLLQNIADLFGFRVLDVKEAEGDDVVAVLTKSFSPIEDILIISMDKDFFQLFELGNVKMFNPIKLKLVPSMNKQDLIEWRVTHIIQGDISDNVPKVVAHTEFNPVFIQYLQKNDIYESDVWKFKQLSISSKLINEYINLYQ